MIEQAERAVTQKLASHPDISTASLEELATKVLKRAPSASRRLTSDEMGQLYSPAAQRAMSSAFASVPPNSTLPSPLAANDHTAAGPPTRSGLFPVSADAPSPALHRCDTPSRSTMETIARDVVQRMSSM